MLEIKGRLGFLTVLILLDQSVRELLYWPVFSSFALLFTVLYFILVRKNTNIGIDLMYIGTCIIVTVEE